jgi:plastocyanin domain-containing protein
MKTKIIWIVFALALAGAAVVVSQRKSGSPETPAAVGSAAAPPAASLMDGKQLIEVAVKEGYHPKAVTAKAGVPTVLKMKTDGTYDCSIVFVIPELKMRTQLPPSGMTDVEIPAQKTGTDLMAVCGMGMYSLEIKFD